VNDKPKHRWYQFSLKTLLLAMTLLAVAISIVVMRVEHQRATVQRVKQLGGRVDYANPEIPWREGLNCRNDSWPIRHLRRWLPGDYFDAVLRVDLHGTDTSDDDVRHLKCLTRLEILDISDTHVTDAALEHVQEFQHLKDLYLDDTHVTDVGIQQLKRLEQLEIVFLRTNNVSWAGVGRLQREMPNCDVVK
jgi:hypothetical protein